MGCPHCESADVRPSHGTLGLERIGLHRYRCRACGGLFWLRGSRVAAVQARRRDYLEAPAGIRLPRRRAETPAPTIDLQALDRELARQQEVARRE